MDAIAISYLTKTYTNGKTALKNISLSVRKGELFALLGPNGAGKTTLIGIVCGVIKKTSGSAMVFGHDTDSAWRKTRSIIGLVPQEITLNPFDTVWETLSFQRGFYGKPKNDTLIERIIKSLALEDKKYSLVRELSGGMKRRVLIGKALTNEPKVLFLDEPSAGVDVELRQGMWDLIRNLKQQGVTIVLTTHYLEEAETMADRIGIINNGTLELVETTSSLLQTMGNKTLIIQLQQPLPNIPTSLASFGLKVSSDGTKILYTYNHHNAQTEILFDALQHANIPIRDIDTKTTSLEEIFVKIIRKNS